MLSKVRRLILSVVRLCLFGIAALAVLGAIFGFYEAGRLADQARKSPGWPVAPGAIEESRIIRASKGDGVRVVYGYSVDEARYSSNTISYARFDGAQGVWLLPDTPQDLVNRYPVGKEVPVYYEPGNPRNAVLEPGTRGENGSATIGSLAMLLIAGAAFLGTRVIGGGPGHHSRPPEEPVDGNRAATSAAAVD